MAGFGQKSNCTRKAKLQKSDDQTKEIINQALYAYRQGKLATAKSLIQTAINSNNKNGFAIGILATIEKAMGNADRSAELFELSLCLDPHNASFHHNYAGLLIDTTPEKAVEHSLAAIKISPKDAEYLSRCGYAHWKSGDQERGKYYCLQAIKSNPHLAAPYLNLGGILKEQGQLDQALAATLKAIELKPDHADAHMNLGGILKEQGQLDQALAATLKAIELKPDHADAHMNLGSILKEQGQLDQALAAYRQAEMLEPKEPRHVASSRLFFSDLHKDNDLINIEREAYRHGIRELTQSASDLKKLNTSISTNMFWIAYHNRHDDREILESLGRALGSLQKATLTQALNVAECVVASKDGIRLGICSDFLRNHTIGKLNTGMIKVLKEHGFHISIFRGPEATTNAGSLGIDSYAHTSIKLPQSLEAASEIIRKEELDVLLYPDIGMSPYTYMLAMFRLAPVQVTSWGHPNTTGLETIDYFMSCESIEPVNAESKYTEQLIKLTKLPCVYTAPETNAISPGSREKFGLPSDQILIGIPQSLFKFHPDYDEVLEEIISRLPNAKFVLIKGQNKPQTERLKSRWGEKAPKTLQNSVFLERMSQDDYLCLLETVDIMLDPIYFGSGNTFYESMAVSTPLVTMPGDYMRGRIVAGGYKQMKLDNAPIAANKQEYIEITVRLAEDADRRKSLKQEIRSAAQKYLFDDQEAADEIIEFIQAAVDCRRETGGLLPVDWIPSKNASL